MIDHLHRITAAAVLFAAIGATPALAEDNQVGILEDGLRVPIEFWWKCVDDPGSSVTDFPSGGTMCEDSDGWAVICDGDPTESACFLYPPAGHPGPGNHASTSTTTTGTMTQSQGSGSAGGAALNGSIQLQIER